MCQKKIVTEHNIDKNKKLFSTPIFNNWIYKKHKRRKARNKKQERQGRFLNKI